MKILSRYILRAFAGPFFFGLLVIIFIFITNFMIKEFSKLLSKDVELSVAIELIILNIAWILALAVPMAVLIGTLMAFGRMSAENEITAMKASGYSLFRASVPVFFISILLTIGMFLFNDRVLPDANFKLEKLIYDINRKNPAISFQPGVFSDDKIIKGFHLLLEDIDHETGWVYGVTIFDNSDKRIDRTIIAEKATLTFNQMTEQIEMVLYNGEIHEVEAEEFMDYKFSLIKEPYTIRIPFESSMLVRRSEGRRGDRSRSIARMKDDIRISDEGLEKRKISMEERIVRSFNEEEDFVKKYIEIAFSLSIDDFERNPRGGGFTIKNPDDDYYIDDINKKGRLSDLLHKDIMYIESKLKYRNKMNVEIQKKYSIPFACIVFVLIGIPLGVKARHGGMSVGGGLGLAFFLLYWTFLSGGEQLADRRIIEPWLAMWGANIIVGVSGLWLLIKTTRETTFFGTGRFGGLFRLLVRGKS